MRKKILFTFIGIILMLLWVNCGSKDLNTNPQKTHNHIFYPPLPNTPRFQYLTTFSTSEDIVPKKSKLFEFVAGKESQKIKIIKKPYGVDIFEGKIFVCDITSQALIVINLKDKKFDYIGVQGTGRLLRPVNVKMDREKKLILVADMGRKQVIAFDLKGNPVKFYGQKGQFEPADVDVFQNKLYVCDVKSHRIHVLDRNTGKSLYQIGKPGSKEGQLFHPSNICIANNRLYVSDTTNFRIQIFDLEGAYLNTFGQAGDTPGTFGRNKGIDVDRQGRIYVVDSLFGNVQVFNKDLKLLLFMFGPGRERHHINLPATIKIDYENIGYFKKYCSPKFTLEYILLVTSNFGRNKVNVYGYGRYQN